MPKNAKLLQKGGGTRCALDRSFHKNLSRRAFLGAGVFLGLAAAALPTECAYAWSSWTNATSPVLKDVGMGDYIHEDLVQISYARVLRNHANDAEGSGSLLNSWWERFWTMRATRRSQAIP